MKHIKLRAHHLLCLQGYEGKGYSPEFVTEMSKLADIFKRAPDTKFTLVAGVDDICKHCPHLIKNKCVHANPPEPQDAKVIKHFALVIGNQYTYKTVTDMIRQKIDAKIFMDICGTCDWNSAPQCRSALGIEKRL